MGLIIGIITGIIILALLVVAHELGHAVTASRNGVTVEEFGVGFPPRAWKKKLRNGVLLSINWLPLGGFVKLQGEHDSASGKGDYGAATFLQKTKILLAGVTVNWLLSAVIFTILAVTGLPRVFVNQFSVASDTTIVSQPVELANINANHSAEKAGLKVGDKIIQFAGRSVPTPESLVALAKQNKGKNIKVVYTREGTEHNVNVLLGNEANGGYFGAGLGQRELIKSTWSAPVVGVVTTAQFTWETFKGMGGMISNLASGMVMQFSSDLNARQQASTDLAAVSSGVAGPIGILGTIFPSAQKAGPTQLLFLTAIISLSLAVMNILPIPALDGGRWFTTAIFKLSKKKLTKEREEKIQSVGFMVLMGLIILVTFADVSKLF